MRTPPELLQGTVDVLVLRALTRHAMHGYAISRWIRERSDDVLAIEGAALYQALHRLERHKLVDAEWGTSENNRKAKFYALTAAGRARLRAESATWHTYAQAVTRVLSPA
jgi:transcriptional regulator